MNQMPELPLSYTVGVQSVLGSRQEQQDTVLIHEQQECLLAAVCDGMGGLQNGQQASRIAARTLQLLHENRTENYPDFFLNAVDILDESVRSLNKASHEHIPCGTTIVAAAVDHGRLYWLSIGDSRLYLVRKNEIVCVTTDHNYHHILQQQLKQGTISEAEYASERNRGEALVSYVGMGGIDLMDLNQKAFPLQKEDVVLLMSDGLYRILSPEQMLHIVRNGDDAQQIAEELIRQSVQQQTGSQDNTSIIVIKMNGAAEV